MTDMQFPILSLITFLPLFGAILVLMLRPGSKQEAAQTQKNIYSVSYWISFITFALSVWMFSHFDGNNPGFQLVEEYMWIRSLNITFKMGIDALSVFFVLLTTTLFPLALFISQPTIKERHKEYCLAFLVLETLVLGSFLALDIVFFYIFFEGVLIPMFLIIGIWGGVRRVYAAYKFFLYTLLGSVLMLLGLIYLYVQTGTTDFSVLHETIFLPEIQMILFWAFFASFAIKVPMWPLHTWLPDAHVEAPTAGSVVLAGILLKMGGYGFLRFSLPLFPLAVQAIAPYMMGLAVISILYASLVALVQEDMKKMIAYSSIAHMGFVILGIFSVSVEGITGAVFQMISHGVVSAALFMCVGVLYSRFHTREIGHYGGLVKVMPKYAFLLMIFVLGSIGLPGTSGFVGEFLSLSGAYMTRNIYAIFGVIGVVLGAVYMLNLYRRLMYGDMVQGSLQKLPDVSRREYVVLATLAFFVLFLGIASYTVIDTVKPLAHTMVQDYLQRTVPMTMETTTSTGTSQYSIIGRLTQ